MKGNPFPAILIGDSGKGESLVKIGLLPRESAVRRNATKLSLHFFYHTLH
jgi:hypothetical protein